ncbi:MAG: T9SS type A sorting domain-containing protein [Melioribacteraceae bacterium]|nr:T9SS type A sorting domain-containing protein [Melioribacteraceae bacterium]
MWRITTRTFILLFFVITSASFAQLISIPIKVSNNHGAYQQLYIGLDPSATDGIDASLNEADLPPLPPNEILDVRLKLPTSAYQYSTRDYRYCTNPPFNAVLTYEILIQRGKGTSVIIEWTFPNEITAVLKDPFGGIFINQNLSGNSSYTFTNGDINRLELVVTYDIKTDIEGENNKPNNFTLLQNYPNPFNPSTIIKFALPYEESVKLTIYNSLGENVVELINHTIEGGLHSVSWDAKSYPSGIYYYTLSAGNYTASKKLILLK